MASSHAFFDIILNLGVQFPLTALIIPHWHFGQCIELQAKCFCHSPQVSLRNLDWPDIVQVPRKYDGNTHAYPSNCINILKDGLSQDILPKTTNVPTCFLHFCYRKMENKRVYNTKKESFI